MTFNSYTFVVFFAVVLLFCRLPFGWTAKKGGLLLASYLFYSAWNPPFVILLWVSTICDWYVARWLFRQEKPVHRKILLAVSLLINLGMLSFFKYGGFLQENFAHLCDAFGVPFKTSEWNIVLPVGISFYTFQTLSYTLDIYYKRIRPWDSFLDYSLYVTFFPQLVAGPIVRSSEFLHQCRTEKRATSHQLGWGMVLLLVGIFQKVVLADAVLAPVTEFVYDNSNPVDTMSAWSGTFAFAGQIFFDFNGYTTCAIGAALCLGFSLPDNFRFPYAAIGFSDFWKRWHISLSSWLRDYLYIPLGGNRSGKLRTYGNLMTTMLLGGLWHGASWSFVVWGGLHGAYLVGERTCVKYLGDYSVWNRPVGRLFLAGLTFVLVCIAWVFFRASEFHTAFSIMRSMFGVGEREGVVTLHTTWILTSVAVMGSLLVYQWKMRQSSLEELMSRIPFWGKSVLLAGIIILIATVSGEDRAFIYFQF